MKKISLFVAILFVSIHANTQVIPSWKITDVARFFSKKNDSVYVVNFWATFCKPCVAEIPYLQSVSKKYGRQKVKLLLVSVDLPSFYPGKIKSFAMKNNFSADIVWLNEQDADYFCPVIDSTWSGSIPATIFINASTGYKKFIESDMSEKQFEEELKKAIGG